MRISINVSIDAEPGDPAQSYGHMQFSEQTEIPRSDFAVVSAVFTRCHELLKAIEQEHRTSSPRK